jgi:hypothetical protein
MSSLNKCKDLLFTVSHSIELQTFNIFCGLNTLKMMKSKLLFKLMTILFRYLMWFEMFNATDRCRLWNKLVFSENYFNYIGNNSRFKRKDIKYVMKQVNSKSNTFLSN